MGKKNYNLLLKIILFLIILDNVTFKIKASFIDTLKNKLKNTLIPQEKNNEGKKKRSRSLNLGNSSSSEKYNFEFPANKELEPDENLGHKIRTPKGISPRSLNLGNSSSSEKYNFEFPNENDLKKQQSSLKTKDFEEYIYQLRNDLKKFYNNLEMKEEIDFRKKKNEIIQDPSNLRKNINEPNRKIKIIEDDLEKKKKNIEESYKEAIGKLNRIINKYTENNASFDNPINIFRIFQLLLSELNKLTKYTNKNKKKLSVLDCIENYKNKNEYSECFINAAKIISDFLSEENPQLKTQRKNYFAQSTVIISFYTLCMLAKYDGLKKITNEDEKIIKNFINMIRQIKILQNDRNLTPETLINIINK